VSGPGLSLPPYEGLDAPEKRGRAIDLKDIGALEQYINETAVVLIFLSKGYFFSRNCLREARASASRSKLLTLVHETDPIKGGLPLSESKMECPSDLFDYVFAENREVIRWHRVIEYQLVSIKQIALHVLVACPGIIQKQLTLGVYFPSELTCSEMHLKGKHAVQLLVSANNPGAKDIAAELVAVFPWISVSTVMESCSQFSSSDDQLEVGSAFPPRGLSAAKHNLKALGDHLSKVTYLVGRSNSNGAFFLLYLNKNTYLGQDGKRLADQIALALGAGVVIFMVHENDEALGGCEFGRFFSTTPGALISAGLYSDIALAFHEQPHREISWALAGCKLGATRRSIWSGLKATLPRIRVQLLARKTVPALPVL